MDVLSGVHGPRKASRTVSRELISESERYFRLCREELECMGGREGCIKPLIRHFDAPFREALNRRDWTGFAIGACVGNIWEMTGNGRLERARRGAAVAIWPMVSEQWRSPRYAYGQRPNTADWCFDSLIL